MRNAHNVSANKGITEFNEHLISLHVFLPITYNFGCIKIMKNSGGCTRDYRMERRILYFVMAVAKSLREFA